MLWSKEEKHFEMQTSEGRSTCGWGWRDYLGDGFHTTRLAAMIWESPSTFLYSLECEVLSSCCPPPVGRRSCKICLWLVFRGRTSNKHQILRPEIHPISPIWTMRLSFTMRESAKRVWTIFISIHPLFRPFAKHTLCFRKASIIYLIKNKPKTLFPQSQS